MCTLNLESETLETVEMVGEHLTPEKRKNNRAEIPAIHVLL